jgi:hypothetical protein
MADIVSYVVADGKYVVIDADVKFVQVALPGFLLTFIGYILSDQGKPITERGFIYGTSSEILNDSVISEDDSTLFEATIEIPAGTYYYKAYATNELGTSYGELKSIVVS